MGTREERCSVELDRNLETVGASTGGAVYQGLKQFLAGIASEPSILSKQSSLDFLTNQIGVRLCDFMFQVEEDLDVKQSLSALSMDSLMAIGIRNWWRQSLGLEISVLKIMNFGSAEQLGKNAFKGMRRKYKVEAEEDGDTYLLMKAS